jgi:protein TonB
MIIRHSSSFFISIVIHVAILFAIIFAWENFPSFKKKIQEKKVCVKLNCIIQKEPKKVIKPKPKPKPKKIKPKPIKKKKPKTKPKPKVKKKVLKKKIIPKKTVPVIKKEIIPQEPVIKEVVQPKITEPKIVEEIQETPIIQESPHAKEVRLEQDYLDEHIRKITQLLEDNLYYPRSARKRGITGEVMVEFKLSTDAQAHSIKINSSKSDILSRAAIKTINNLSGEFPKPKEELILHVPISYKLRR